MSPTSYQAALPRNLVEMIGGMGGRGDIQGRFHIEFRGVKRTEFTILIDGDCPLCRKEARLLAWMDRGRGRLRQINIAAEGFDPGAYGCTTDDLMGTIHGVRADGAMVTGVEVFRQAYAAVGWGWLLGWTGLPFVRPAADRAYEFFAKYRLRLTGRCADERCAASQSV